MCSTNSCHHTKLWYDGENFVPQVKDVRPMKTTMTAQFMNNTQTEPKHIPTFLLVLGFVVGFVMSIAGIITVGVNSLGSIMWALGAALLVSGAYLSVTSYSHDKKQTERKDAEMMTQFVNNTVNYNDYTIDELDVIYQELKHMKDGRKNKMKNPSPARVSWMVKWEKEIDSISVAMDDIKLNIKYRI